MASITPAQRQILTDIYYDSTGKPGAYSSLIPLWKAARQIDGSITQKSVQEFLSSNASYLAHKRAVYHFRRRGTLVLYPHHIWSIDLAFYLNDKSVSNANQSLFLSVVDVFSKYAFCRSAARKTADEILQCFRSIVAEAGHSPRMIFADRGPEFYNEKFKNYCKEHSILLYSSNTALKSYPVEQFQGIIKRAIGRRLTWRRDRSWVRVLQNSVKTYNQTSSAALDNLSPFQAIQPKNTGRLQTFFLKRRYDLNKKYGKKPPQFSLGDHVKRLLKNERLRRRGDHQRFSKQIYEIAKITNTSPATYKIKLLGTSDILPESFYSQELARVIDPKTTEASLTSRKIIEIIESRRFPIKWLRSGRAIEHETRFLAIDNNNEKKFFTEAQLMEYDNGKSMLDIFLQSKSS